VSGRENDGVPVADGEELAGRIRAALATRPSVREVPMFGGLSFMVNEAMVVSVRSGGDLLVRVDPQRAEEYLQIEGACPAKMGAGRTMGRGWLAVDADALAGADELAFWLAAALEFNGTTAEAKGRRSSGRKARAVR
jgi:TfoX/Sxy family transcriptional regulator of competence genes